MKKEEIISMLEEHETHREHTTKRFAARVKVWDLHLATKEENWFYVVLNDPAWNDLMWQEAILPLINRFKAKMEGYDIVNAGRMGGWLELHGLDTYFAYYWKTLTWQEMQHAGRVVREFDRTVEKIKEAIKDWLNRAQPTERMED